MRKIVIAVAVVVALGVFAGATSAQQPANSRKPSQTPDQGVDDDKTPPGQARKGPAERSAAQVPVTVHSNGIAVAELDESFDEAIVVTLDTDGTRTYQHVQGPASAAAFLEAEPSPAVPEPVLEEK